MRLRKLHSTNAKPAMTVIRITALGFIFCLPLSAMVSFTVCLRAREDRKTRLLTKWHQSDRCDLWRTTARTARSGKDPAAVYARTIGRSQRREVARSSSAARGATPEAGPRDRVNRGLPRMLPRMAETRVPGLSKRRAPRRCVERTARDVAPTRILGKRRRWSNPLSERRDCARSPPCLGCLR